jgi:hypothetical protein
LGFGIPLVRLVLELCRLVGPARGDRSGSNGNCGPGVGIGGWFPLQGPCPCARTTRNRERPAYSSHAGKREVAARGQCLRDDAADRSYVPEIPCAVEEAGDRRAAPPRPRGWRRSRSGGPASGTTSAKVRQKPAVTACRPAARVTPRMAVSRSWTFLQADRSRGGDKNEDWGTHRS